jgi:hypothetical protein
MSIFKKAQSQDDMDIFAPFIRWGHILQHDSPPWQRKILSDDMIRKYSKYFDDDAWFWFYNTANPIIEIPKKNQDEIDEYYVSLPHQHERIRQRLELAKDKEKQKSKEKQKNKKNTMTPEISQNTSDLKDNMQGEQNS